MEVSRGAMHKKIQFDNTSCLELLAVFSMTFSSWGDSMFQWRGGINWLVGGSTCISGTWWYRDWYFGAVSVSQWPHVPGFLIWGVGFCKSLLITLEDNANAIWLKANSSCVLLECAPVHNILHIKGSFKCSFFSKCFQLLSIAKFFWVAHLHHALFNIW